MTFTGAIGAICMLPLRAIISISVALGIHPNVLTLIGVLINVAPPQGVPDLKLVGTGVAVEKPGKHHPTITVENATPVHALLQQATVKLSSGSWSQTLSPAEIGQKIGSGLVQPGKRRKFTLPVDLPPGVTKVEASIDYKPKRS